jgi:hypothetical protein
LAIFDESLTENLPKARPAFPISSVPALAENGPRRAKLGADALFRLTGSAGPRTF